MALETLFKMYDGKGKGYIDSNDLIRVSEITGIPLEASEIEEMLVSETEPGKVKFEEFMEIMNDQNLWF